MSVVDKKYLETVRKQIAAYEAARREVIKLSGDALSASKRAIFALHRDDHRAAIALLSEAEAGFKKVRQAAEDIADLTQEGSYRAALEEYVEARLYEYFLEKGTIGKVAGDDIDYEIFLSGLSDLTGELQRRQVRLATEGRVDEVKKIKEAIEEVIDELTAMDLGGYLRNKFDQAKNNLRRAEDVLYEVTIRRK